MTTAEDYLRDRLVEAAASYCMARGLRYGVDRLVTAMLSAAEDEAADIRRESQRQTEMELRA